MSTVLTPSRTPELEREIWRLLRQVAGNHAFADACEKRLSELIEKGVHRLKFEVGTGESARTLEAKDNFRLLIETMKKLTQEDDSAVLDVAHLESALSKLCPLFPIC